MFIYVIACVRIPFLCQVIFYCLYMPYFVYSFIRQQTFRLFSHWYFFPGDSDVQAGMKPKTLDQWFSVLAAH